jgi:hypothetical protein
MVKKFNDSDEKETDSKKKRVDHYPRGLDALMPTIFNVTTEKKDVRRTFRLNMIYEDVHDILAELSDRDGARLICESIRYYKQNTKENQ